MAVCVDLRCYIQTQVLSWRVIIKVDECLYNAILKAFQDDLRGHKYNGYVVT